MTRRERKETRLTRRLDWASGRRDKARRLEAANEPFRGDVAFNTQPGHIPERARAIARSDRAWEHQKMAAHHDAKAAGIAHQLDTSVFSDDPDAPERLRERIAGLEQEQERMKKINKVIRKGAGWEERLAAAGLSLTAREKQVLTDVARFQPYYGTPHGVVFPPYALSNLGANVRRLKARLVSIEARRGETT